jgi:hypothetical protein
MASPGHGSFYEVTTMIPAFFYDGTWYICDDSYMFAEAITLTLLPDESTSISMVGIVIATMRPEDLPIFVAAQRHSGKISIQCYSSGSEYLTIVEENQ